MRALLLPTTLLSILLSGAVNAKGKEAPVLRYHPPADLAEERPLPLEISITATGINYALHVVYNREPWGEACQNRCANTTLFLDTDNNRATGLKLGRDAAETGADLAVTIQGVRDFKDTGADTRLRVKVRQLGSDAKSMEDGSPLTELDARRDTERLREKGPEVWAELDGTDPSIPSGKTMRIVYHPPATKALEATVPGQVRGGRAVQITGPGLKKKGRH